ncbi:unnamed protein product [Callosobruchus maculatus]|uniref:Uncharacterized protein n=1 Tax=Callosobruchus maculatus TaxID=64391 RepID=A0A653CXZ4_CALMS|nr:unnamed protein product [Callosobruchus maculatus]
MAKKGREKKKACKQSQALEAGEVNTVNRWSLTGTKKFDSQSSSSDILSKNAGVPQGPVLSSTPFLLYIKQLLEITFNPKTTEL